MPTGKYHFNGLSQVTDYWKERSESMPDSIFQITGSDVQILSDEVGICRIKFILSGTQIITVKEVKINADTVNDSDPNCPVFIFDDPNNRSPPSPVSSTTDESKHAMTAKQDRTTVEHSTTNLDPLDIDETLVQSVVENLFPPSHHLSHDHVLPLDPLWENTVEQKLQELQYEYTPKPSQYDFATIPNCSTDFNSHNHAGGPMMNSSIPYAASSSSSSSSFTRADIHPGHPFMRKSSTHYEASMMDMNSIPVVNNNFGPMQGNPDAMMCANPNVPSSDYFRDNTSSYSSCYHTPLEQNTAPYYDIPTVPNHFMKKCGVPSPYEIYDDHTTTVTALSRTSTSTSTSSTMSTMSNDSDTHSILSSPSISAKSQPPTTVPPPSAHSERFIDYHFEPSLPPMLVNVRIRGELLCHFDVDSRVFLTIFNLYPETP